MPLTRRVTTSLLPFSLLDSPKSDLSQGEPTDLEASMDLANGGRRPAEGIRTHPVPIGPS